MNDSSVKDFLYYGDAVQGEPDYGLADNFVRTSEALHLPTVPAGATILLIISARKE